MVSEILEHHVCQILSVLCDTPMGMSALSRFKDFKSLIFDLICILRTIHQEKFSLWASIRVKISEAVT